DPQYADQGQRQALHGIETRPGRTGGQQEANGNRGDKAPEHFVGVPGHGEEGCGHKGGCEDPDRDGDQGPGATQNVEGTEAQAEEHLKIGGRRGRPAGSSFMHCPAPVACGWVPDAFDSRTTGCVRSGGPVHPPGWPCRDCSIQPWSRERATASVETWRRPAPAGRCAWAWACHCTRPSPAKAKTRSAP